MSPRGRPLCTAILALVTLGLSLSACGGDEGGASTLNWYVFDEPGGSFTNAAKNCSTEGYDIKVQVLPADADQQREQLVRRLAAGDTSIDLIGMDVMRHFKTIELDFGRREVVFETGAKAAPSVVGLPGSAPPT